MSIHDAVAEYLARFHDDPDRLIDEINALRHTIHQMSPLREHPVDFVEWVPVNDVTANDYNPNNVAPPEMELLRVSIAADGYTQPIVTNREDVERIVIDGFHRNRVGKECPDVADRLLGRLPVVQIRSEQTDRSDRIAATIRHNRARGKHSVVKMTDIVLELKRRNWTDKKIAKELGMDDDEVLPPQMEEHYRNKILLHVKWWQERGFPDGLPDESPYELEAARKAPSWRRVCKSLLRNDYWGKGLGFSQHKSDAYNAYLDLMKRRRDVWGVDSTAIELPFDAVVPVGGSG